MYIVSLVIGIILLITFFVLVLKNKDNGDCKDKDIDSKNYGSATAYIFAISFWLIFIGIFGRGMNERSLYSTKLNRFNLNSSSVCLIDAYKDFCTEKGMDQKVFCDLVPESKNCGMTEAEMFKNCDLNKKTCKE